VIRLEWNSWIPDAPETIAPRVELIEITPVPPKLDTIDVAFVADTPATPHTRERGAPERTIVAAAGAATSSSGTVETKGTASDGPKKSLGMRGPELHPADDQLAHIADAPGHEPPPGTISSNRVEDAPGGRAVIDDAVTTIDVDKDGTAHLHDKPDADAHIDINPLAVVTNVKDAGKTIADWAVDPEASKKFGRTQDLPAHLQASAGQCSSWGDALCDDQEAPDSEKATRKRGIGGGAVALFGLSGKFDVTSMLMNKLGVGDAYSSRKLKALDDTRLERAERGAKYKQQQLDHSALLMQDNLERVWAGTQNVDERKAVLFELWDECAEGDGPIGEAGERARKMVVGWIRAKLPAGKPGAFTAAEITALDKHRTSHQPFAPY
jgi:hypothetical protein